MKTIHIYNPEKNTMSQKNEEHYEKQLSFNLKNLEASNLNSTNKEIERELNNKKNIYDEKQKSNKEAEYKKRYEEDMNYLESEDLELWSHVFDKSQEDIKNEWEQHFEKRIIPKLDKIFDDEIEKLEPIKPIEIKGDINEEAEALGSLAWNKMISGKDREAVEDYTKAIAKSPNNRMARSWFGCRAEAFEKLGECEKALEDANKALEISLNGSSHLESGISYLSVAILQIKLNLFEEALFSINNSIKLDPDNDEAYKVRARIYISFNDFESAKKDIEIYKNWYK